MNLQTITVGGNSVACVPMPGLGQARMLEFSMLDSVAIVPGAYSRETQAFNWPGADEWSVKVTLPPLQTDYNKLWTSWLMAMRGQLRGTLISDPTYKGPQGYLLGSVPVLDNGTTGNNAPGTTTVYLKGLAASTHNVVRTGDRLQIGYRMHQAVFDASSDSGGKTSFEVWPSLRDATTDGQSVNFNNPQGLFRLASNTRGYSVDINRTTAISFPLVEYRGNGNS